MFYSYVNVTLNKTLKEDGPFIIIKDVFEWEWQEIVTEYNITEAFKKTEQGDSMISLESGITLNLKDSFTKDEILNKWIEKFI